MSAKDNEKVINAAFARLILRKDTKIRVGMERMMAAAVEYALESHDEKHQAHVEMGDTYGWAVYHNGIVMAVNVNAGDAGLTMGAAQMLRDMAPMVGSGWVGVVMAGMNPSTYFRVDYEMGILHETINFTRTQFNKYFRKI